MTDVNKKRRTNSGTKLQKNRSNPSNITHSYSLSLISNITKTILHAQDTKWH